jgi:hypothetical protein
VRLPIEVYQSITRPDLGDLRVFNARGEPVPHELWSSPDEERVERKVVPARAFPLLAASPDELKAIRVRIESGKESVGVALSPGSEAREVVAYVLDPGPVDASYVGERLILHWEPSGESFVRQVRVEGSDDLSSFRVLASGVVADLRRDGERLLRNEIPLESSLTRYLKLTGGDGAFPLRLTGVELTLRSKTERAEVQWHEIATLRSEEQGLVFETPGPVHVEAIDVLPPETNTWTEVQLFSRPDANAPWVLRANSAVYRFDGADTRVEVRPARDRYWRLTTDESRGGFGSIPPALRVGYRPDEMLFVARGEPPFEIAYGNRRAGPPPRTAQSLRKLASSDDGRFVSSSDVVLGEPRALAGQKALSEPLIRDWKSFVLWGALGAASLALLLIARAALKGAGAR